MALHPDFYDAEVRHNEHFRVAADGSAAHDTGNGVLFDSRAWIVTAVHQR
jgi:hypothetical protein